MTEVPSYPAFQTAGALICPVLRSRAASTRPSSQILGVAATPVALTRFGAGASCFQNRPRSSSEIRTACASMLSSVRAGASSSVNVVSLRTAAAGTPVSKPMIRGRVSVCAASYFCLMSALTLNNCRSRRPAETRSWASEGSTVRSPSCWTVRNRMPRLPLPGSTAAIRLPSPSVVTVTRSPVISRTVALPPGEPPPGQQEQPLPSWLPLPSWSSRPYWTHQPRLTADGMP
ncbi:hypothetical protein HEP87_58875 [Streptomyces sp. S1D4-11]